MQKLNTKFRYASIYCKFWSKTRMALRGFKWLKSANLVNATNLNSKLKTMKQAKNSNFNWARLGIFLIFILGVTSLKANSMDFLMGKSTTNADLSQNSSQTLKADKSNANSNEQTNEQTQADASEQLDKNSSYSWTAIKTKYYALQLDFYKYIADIVTSIKTGTNPTGTWILIWISFLYGVFHAAGPGHGKAVIATYLTSQTNAKTKKALILAFLMAQTQALTAIVLVFVTFGLVKSVSKSINSSLNSMYFLSGIILTLLGIWLIVQAVKGFYQYFVHKRHSSLAQAGQNCTCSHTIELSENSIDTKNTSWQELLIIASVGLRPCSGAIMILVFCQALGIWHTGILAVLAMGLGVGLSMILLALLAVFFRDFAKKMLKSNSNFLPISLAILKIIGGLFIFSIAIMMFGAKNATSIANMLQ